MASDTGEIRFARALVLGATGMIGAHAVRACLKRDIPVRALIRPTSEAGNLEGLDVERVPGDLADQASLRSALEDCDLFIHAAAPYPTHHFGKVRLIAQATHGLRNLLEVAREAPGLRRLVYVSSVTTIGIPAGEDGRPAPHTRPARESDVQFPVDDDAPYFGVKVAMERQALDAAQAGVPVVVVNPTFCVDALDARRTTAQLMIPLARRQVPAYIPGYLNAVATQDVGTGILLAALRGRVGQRYILGGENMRSQEFLARCAREVGVSAPRLAMPIALAEVVSFFTECVAHVTGTRPLFPMTGIRMMKHSQVYDIGKARGELGYEPTSVDAAIRRAYEWYRAKGML